MIINHVGIAVEDIEQAGKEYEKWGYVKEGEVICDESRNIRVQYITNDKIRFELVAPFRKSERSPVDRFIGKGKAYDMYHICYEVQNIEDAIKEYKEKGYYVMEEPRSAIAMNECRTVYLFHRCMGLVELVEV